MLQMHGQCYHVIRMHLQRPESIAKNHFYEISVLQSHLLTFPVSALHFCQMDYSNVCSQNV
jgi:hypothetical protein